MRKDDRITIYVSPGELFWIAGNLKLNSLPLIGGYFRGRTPDQIRDELQQGYSTLESRGYIITDGTTREVDQTLVNLVNMIASPNYALLVSTSSKEGATVQTYVYVKGSQSLSLVLKSRLYHITLYREEPVLIRSYLEWLGIGMQTAEKAVPFRMPQKDMRTLLSKVWLPPPQAQAALLESGLSQAETNKMIEMLQPFTFVSSVNRLGWQNNQIVKQGSVFLVGNTSTIWLVENPDASTEPPTLQPMAAKSAALIVNRYLRLELTGSSDDSLNEVIS